MFFLNMVDYPVFFTLLSTLIWDTFLTLRGTQGFYRNYVLPWMIHLIMVQQVRLMMFSHIVDYTMSFLLLSTCILFFKFAFQGKFLPYDRIVTD